MDITNDRDESLSMSELNELEERRLSQLEEANIDEKDILDKAHDDINMWVAYFNENVTRGKEDLEFVMKDQWTAVERSEFNRLFKPAMTFNKLHDVVKKIVGEQRKNKPDLLVRSLTGKATQDEINLRADLVRTISYQSQNDLVYQNAFKSALLTGYGAFQVGIDYETPKSFRRMIKFDLIPDATYTAFDATAIKPHKGDGNFCSRQFVFSKKQFEAEFPFISNPISYVDPRKLIDFQWQAKDTIIVCDYFVKEWFSVILYQLSNGMAVTKEEWSALQKEIKFKKELASETAIVKGMILDEIPRIVGERQSQDYRIMHYRLLKNQIIDFAEWPSKFLPIIFVDGDSTFIDGQQYTRSFINGAKDAQKCINYFGSEIAAEIRNRRREQWIGTPDNIIGQEQMWRNAELQNGILLANPDPKTGQLPQKMPPSEIPQSILLQYQRASQDIREILGFSEQESLQGRDISGKARRERKLEGSMSAYVFFDNLNQAIEQAGRVVLDLLPTVYGENDRGIVINKKDGKSKPIMLNRQLDNGEVENPLIKGDFDIEIDTGPSFAVQQEISLDFFQQTIAANPQIFPLIADLWAKNLDIQWREQVAERFKTLVPPEVLAKEEGKPLPPKQPSPQEQFMQQEMKLREQQLIERAEELKIRQEKHELEKAELAMQAKEMISKMHMDGRKSQTEMRKADLDFSAKIAKVLADLHVKNTSNMKNESR